MDKNIESTTNKAASTASKLLSKHKTPKNEERVAAFAFTQARNKKK